MFEARSIEPLTKEFILNRISQEDIFLKYMNIYPDVNQYYCNPLRKDNHPDCRFYWASNGMLKFKDYAVRLNIDCFNLVQIVCPDAHNYGLVLKRISEDFKLDTKEIDYSVVANWENSIQEASKQYSLITVKRKEFTNQELQWWKEQGIHKEILSLFKVSSLQILWLNGRLLYNYTKADIGFVYHFGEYNYKAYFPLRTSYRFIQNIDSSILQGYEQLPEGGDFIVITKSMKDVMLLYTYGIPAVAPTSETVLIEEKIFSELSNRFFHVFTLFDRDRAGMQMSQTMRKKYGTTPLLFESKGLFRQKLEPKDFTDHYKYYGNQYMLELIEETKQQYL